MAKANRKLGSLVIALLAGVLLAGCAFFGWVVWVADGIFARDETDHTATWSAFYEGEVKSLFTIPSEAEIVSAKEMHGFMEGSIEVVFRLPATKTPEEWLGQIAKDSGLDGHRVTKHWYDAGWHASQEMGRERMSDAYELRYRPEDDTYLAFWATD